MNRGTASGGLSEAGASRLDADCRERRRRNPVWAAKMGMFSTCDEIDAAKAKHDPVLIADARTSMCDYRLALSLALGREPDRNGYSMPNKTFPIAEGDV